MLSEVEASGCRYGREIFLMWSDAYSVSGLGGCSACGEEYRACYRYDTNDELNRTYNINSAVSNGYFFLSKFLRGFKTVFVYLLW